MVGTGLVRSLNDGQEPYSIQYSRSNVASFNNLVTDMHMGGADPMHIALGNAPVYHMNNCCCPIDANGAESGTLVRVMHIGARTCTGFHIKQNAVRANINLTRAIFLESERRLTEIGYPLPLDMAGKLRLPMEFFYGTQNNSSVPRPTRTPSHLSPEDQRCGCLTMLDHR
jgi:hypothetical protein